jgi:hypothetical protein
LTDPADGGLAVIARRLLVLSARFSKARTPYVQAFTRGLAETGYIVGQNVWIEYRWAEGHYEM